MADELRVRLTERGREGGRGVGPFGEPRGAFTLEKSCGSESALGGRGNGLDTGGPMIIPLLPERGD